MSVTAAKKFAAAGVHAGIRRSAPDLALVRSIKRLLTLPQTAIIFNPYGNMVYLVTEESGPDGKSKLVAKQTVVQTGQTRGDQIAILSGLKEGDRVISAGQMKVQNGAAITINNAIQPSNDPDPQPHEK